MKARNGPKAVSCYICGRQYMIHSFEIHEKQCRELFEKREELKPAKERKSCPPNPMGGKKIGSSIGDIDMYNAAASESYSSAMSECKFCSRRFLPEKLEIHNRSCRADNPSRRVTDSVNRFPASINKQLEDQVRSQNEFSSGGESNTKCSECGRSFNIIAYAKHSQICRKLNGSKRKVFDSAQARAKGTEMAAYYQQSVKNNGIQRQSGVRRASEFSGNSALAAAYNLRDKNKVNQRQSQSSEMPKWKRDSLAFRQAMRAARAYEKETSSNSQSMLRGRDDGRNRGVSTFPNRSTSTQGDGNLSAIGSNNLLSRSVQKGSTSAVYRPMNGRQSSEINTNKSSRMESNLGYKLSQQSQKFDQYQPAMTDPSYLQCPHCSRYLRFSYFSLRLSLLQCITQ